VASTSAETKRHLELDGLRGFAVMGILAMNIVGFAMPFMAYMSPAVYGGTDPADLWAWFIAYVLFDGKMRGLFSLLFGASMMLIITRAEEKGANPASVHYSRMAWLAFFGLAHFYFIWFGDILFLYAVAGAVVFLFRKLEPQKLIVLALVIYAAYFLVMAGGMGSIYMLEGAANAPGAGAEAVRQYREVIAGFEAGPDDMAKQLAVHQGSWAGIVADKFENELFYPLSLIASNIGETLALMLLGMAFYKTGFLLGEKPAATYRNWAILGLGLGGASFVVIGLYVWSTGFDLLDTMNAALAWTVPGRLLMTIGYASALVLLIQRFGHSGFIARVVAAGRAAFTNYLGTSIAMTTIFYGYGFGLFGEVGRAELYLFVIGAWIVMLLWSKPWLTRYRYGPFEWLWRSLARRQLQPMRRLNAPV
jgi:uncharacterized protein